jgi:regulator of replication initiation timing
MSYVSLSKTILAAYDQIGDLKNSIDQLENSIDEVVKQRIEDESLMRQALEALDCILSPLCWREIDKVDAAIVALKERLR